MHSHLAGSPLRGEFNEVVLLKMPVLFINHGAKEATSPPSSSSSLEACLKHVCLFSKEGALGIHEADGGRKPQVACKLGS